MNFIVLLLTQLLSNLPGVMGDYFKKQGDLVNADLEYKRQLLQAQVVMAGEAARAQLEYQTAALNATTPIFKQRIFWFLSIPIILTVCLPNYAMVLWGNVRLIPEFYWTLYSAMVLTIWGIPVTSNLVSRAFTGFTDYTATKRADKIELQRVSSAQYKAALFDALRHVQGSLNQKEVDNIDKALNLMDNGGK